MTISRAHFFCMFVAPLSVACSDDGFSAAEQTSAASDTTGNPGNTTPGTNSTPGMTASSPSDPSTSGSGTGGDTNGTTEQGNDTTGATGATGASTGDETLSSSSGFETSTSTGADASTGVAEDDTIYAIQNGTIATGVDVEVRGVIVTGVAGSAFFAEEPGGGEFSGVLVFVGAAPAVAVGDEVDITGTTEEFNELTEINATLGMVTPTGVTGLDLTPDLVTEANLNAMSGEPWEGVLVRIEGAPLSVVNVPGFDEFDVSDGGPDLARVDNFLYNAFDFPVVFPGLEVGASFTAVQGPLNFSFGEYKIAPRDQTDFEGYLSAPI